MQDLIVMPKYLVTFTVGYKQRLNIDAAIKKVSLSPLSLYTYVSLSVNSVYMTVLRELYNPPVSL